MDAARKERLNATLNARAPASPPQAALLANLAGMVANTIQGSTQRADWLRRIFDPRRDINTECGYPDIIVSLAYRIMYDRELGRRVVNVFPEETWKQFPVIYEDEDAANETPFEQDLDALEKRHHLLHYLQRADELSGVGHYGVILWGLSDGLSMSQPVAGCESWEESTGGMKTAAVPVLNEQRQKRRVLFIRVLDESLVSVADYETNQNSPRYGMPNNYLITLADPNRVSDQQTATPPDLNKMRVHWSRVTHVADNRKTSEVMGTPRQEPVWNRLCDLRKVLGGSGEMFWKGGFPGISLETNPGLENIQLDVAATRRMMDDYQNGLQRYLALENMTAKSLAPQIADPTQSFEVQIKAICVTLGVPYRVFMGIEEGVVSGDQATKAWAERLRNRQARYVTPMIINPVIQRLIDYGVLAPTAKPGGWTTEWPDLLIMTPEEKAKVAGLVTDALSKYLQGGVDTLVPPLQYLTQVCGMQDETARAVLEAAVEHIEDVEDDEETVPGHVTPPIDPAAQDNPAGGAANPGKRAPVSKPKGKSNAKPRKA